MTRGNRQHDTKQYDVEQQPDKEKEENQRPKRKTNKPHYLRDFV